MNHSHALYDADPHFKIDPISRRITNNSSSKTVVIQHDHNSERFTFEVPRYIEGHDTAECNRVEIHYLNIEVNTKLIRAGVYSVDDLHVKEGDENTVVCSWLIGYNATQFVGQLQFLVRFACVNEENGKVEYAWNSAVYNGVAVSNGIYNADTSIDNPVPAFNFVTTVNGDMLKFFVGTKDEYNALKNEEKRGVFAVITNETTFDDIIDGIVNGDFTIKNAEHAATAKHATKATNATNAELLNGCKEAAYDATNGGFIIKEAGVYLLIGSAGGASHKTYYRDIIAIPDITNTAFGSVDMESLTDTSQVSYSYYMSYDFTDIFNPEKYRLFFRGNLGITDYKAFKIMSL